MIGWIVGLEAEASDGGRVRRPGREELLATIKVCGFGSESSDGTDGAVMRYGGTGISGNGGEGSSVGRYGSGVSAPIAPVKSDARARVEICNDSLCLTKPPRSGYVDIHLSQWHRTLGSRMSRSSLLSLSLSLSSSFVLQICISICWVPSALCCIEVVRFEAYLL